MFILNLVVIQYWRQIVQRPKLKVKTYLRNMLCRIKYTRSGVLCKKHINQNVSLLWKKEKSYIFCLVPLTIGLLLFSKTCILEAHALPQTLEKFLYNLISVISKFLKFFFFRDDQKQYSFFWNSAFIYWQSLKQEKC